MSQLQFDATKVAPQGDRSPVPEGEYDVILKTTEMKPTQDKAGNVLACGFEIITGPLTGQKIFNNINVQHSTAMAQQIGQERLSALCHCVGVLQITDSTQLHGKPLKVKVVISKADARYNDIVAFLKADGTAPTGSAATAATPTSGAPAWATQPAAPAPAPVAPAPAPLAPAPAPVYMPPAPAAPAPSPAAPPAFPPEGWIAHPTPGYFYKGQEVLTEADLRARFAGAAPAPAAPPPPGSPPWMTPAA